MGDDDDAGGTTIRDLGVVSGTELVTNGTFQADTDWSKDTGVTIAGGKAVWTDTGNNVGVTQTVCNIGDTYTVTFTVSDYSSGSVRVRYPFESATRRQANGTYTETGVATSTSLYIQGETVGGNPTFKVDNVSVTTDNLVTNGGFSNNSVPDTWNGSAPVNLAGWTSGGAAFTADAHFVITDGKCRLITDGTNAVINSGTVVVGRTYQYSIDVTDVTTGGLTLIGGGHVLEANITSTGTYIGFYTATATGAISINRNAGGGGVADFTFDNVSVKQINGNPGTLVNTPTFSTDIP